jgi:hypothetical protein
MNRTAAALIASLAGLISIDAGAAPLRADHPLLGTWELKLPNSTCVDRMTFLQSGRVLTTSGAEVGESDSEIADQPDNRGFFKWIDKVVTDNGKADCVGSVTPVGDVAVDYIRLDESGDHFALCFSESKSNCVGPYVRRRLPR